MNKNSKLLSFLVAMVLAVCAVAPIHKSVADVIDDIMSDFASFEKSGSATGQDWFGLAQKARTSGSLDIARLALARAENRQFSPVRLGIEKARLDISAGDPAAAVEKLQTVSDAGFTSVGIFSQDPVINTLAGRVDYDELVTAMSVTAYPCQHQPGFSDFDFWVGEWDVAVANGTLAGSNSIQPAEKGCVLIENWTNVSGGSGMSVNYLDKSTDEWVQVWNSEDGSQINIRGGLTGEGMLLEGFLHTVRNGTTVPFRGLWTPLPDGRVRQFFEQSNDGGETWVPWFEGFYDRKDQREQVQ